MEKVVSTIVGLGIPGIVALFMINATGLVGAAAITATLATLGGPGGMMIGIGVLVALGIISKGIAEYGLKRILQAVVEKMKSDGTSVATIIQTIEGYPITKSLKRDIISDLKGL